MPDGGDEDAERDDIATTHGKNGTTAVAQVAGAHRVACGGVAMMSSISTNKA